MSHLEYSKIRIVRELRGLCAHCARGREHVCPIQEIAAKVRAIRGVPVMVDNEFRGVVMAQG